MADLDSTQITAIAAAICAVIGLFFSERAVNAYKTWSAMRADARRDRAAQVALDRELDEKGFKAIIRRQDKQIAKLEEDYNEIRCQHSECREELAVLKAKYDSVVMRLELLERHTHIQKEDT